MNSPEVTLKKALPQQSKALPTAVPLADLLTGGSEGAVPVKRKKGAAAQEWDAIVKAKDNATNSFSRSPRVDNTSREQALAGNGPSSSPMKKGWAMNQSAPADASQGWARRQPSKKTNGGGLVKSRPAISVIPLPDESDRSRTPIHPVSFLGKMSRNNAFGEDKSESELKTNIGNASSESRQIFTGCSFLLLGDASCDSVSSALQQAGGMVLTEGNPDYYIVRFVG
jgi:hypothetical protein